MAKKKSNKEEPAAKDQDQNVENEAVQNPEVEEEATAETEVSELESLQQELEAAKNRAQEATDQYLRLMAEFDNFRKRSRREMGTMRDYASESVLTALLPVIDNFERSLTAMDKTDNLSSVKEGIQIVNENLHRVLEKEGLNAIESVNQPFDSELHEAIHSMPVEEEEKKGMVLEEVEKGYRLKDKVIRYAKVIVGE
ncbi:MAG: nucleotide exchange factor GrpE [Bacteroidota bacterium]